MDLQCDGERVLVTGSSIGIGEAVAHAPARDGAADAVHGRDRGRAERVASGIAGEGGRAVVATGELTDDPAAARRVAIARGRTIQSSETPKRGHAAGSRHCAREEGTDTSVDPRVRPADHASG